MKSIRRFVYAATLTLSALSLMPILAPAQEAHGKFKLTSDVTWQNNLIPAGEYTFSINASGPSALLQLRSLSGSHSGTIMLVNDTTPSQPKDVSSLVMISRPSGNYISALKLPDTGVTLHFTVPAEAREMAKADTIAAASAR